ncbi:MAG TPA: dephospho-CoA kinase [Rhizomicrobium sp.]|nr:dephospho-CoA kinase [Rhizomicrobium sp.]
MPARRPLHVGLTGSIGMGKSETARMFASLGVPVYDADAAVHRLYAVGGAAVAPIGAAFPGTVTDGAVDRAELSRHVTGNPEATQRLQAIVYPLMAGERRKFLEDAEAADADIVVFDIPLLFETKGEANMDAVVVASAPAHIQRERVLTRPGMTEEKFAYLHSRQTPDAEKRAKAHFVVVTDKGLAHAFDQVKMIVATLRDRRAEEK